MKLYRKCPRCKKNKEIKFYGKDSTTKNKLRVYCKTCEKIKRRISYVKNRQKRINSTKKWRKNNYHKFMQYVRKRRNEVKIELVNGYGGKCECCGENRIVFLSLDHINRDGKIDRKRFYTSDDLYRHLIKRGFPEGYRILCMNCNFATRYGNECPHKLEQALEGVEEK